MKNTKHNQNIYELEGVYGDTQKLIGRSSNRLEKMLDMIEIIEDEPKNALDIGCGTGHFSNLVKTLYPESCVYGVDISNKAISIGKKKYKNINFVKADAEVKLPFKDNKFDLVISGEHIEHIVDVDTNLLEINRVTKKGGILVMTTPNLGSWINRILLLLGKQPWYLEPSLRKTLPIFKIGNYSFPEDLDSKPSGHLRLYTLNMIKKLLSAYGFEVVEVQGRSMMSKIPLKQIDGLFSNIPELAYGLIIKAKKY